MTLSGTNSIEGVNGGPHQRLYIPSLVSGDSQYPFRIGQDVRFEVIETTRDRQALVVLPDGREVDRAATELVTASANSSQTSLEEASTTHD